MKFLDQCKIYIRSGNGGAGSVSFLREKFIHNGGPDGGDGGRGGHVIIEAVDGLNTLIDYRYKQHFKAQTGTHGMGRQMHGANAPDLILKVPAGTQVFEDDQETLICDLNAVGDRVQLARGGNGGFGNTRFKGPVNQAPRFALPGQDGEERWIWLRLKLIADYPFTTLVPNLGVVDLGPESRMVIADIPGLIEGASEGAGLGTRFLGHVERTKVLIHLIDATAEDPVKSYRVIRHELETYAEDLAKRPEIVGLNKVDAIDATRRKALMSKLKRACGQTPYAISGVTGEGVRTLLFAALAICRPESAATAQTDESQAATPYDPWTA